ncbi:MAG: hypothetical protein NVS9B9_28990 [Ktedonobacteraceae bacterium]
MRENIGKTTAKSREAKKRWRPVRPDGQTSAKVHEKLPKKRGRPVRADGQTSAKAQEKLPKKRGSPVGADGQTSANVHEKSLKKDRGVPRQVTRKTNKTNFEKNFVG